VLRYRADDDEIKGKTSYELVTPEAPPAPQIGRQRAVLEAPAVQAVVPLDHPAPPSSSVDLDDADKPGFFVRLWHSMFAAGAEEPPAKPAQRQKPRRPRSTPSSQPQENASRGQRQQSQNQGQNKTQETTTTSGNRRRSRGGGRRRRKSQDSQAAPRGDARNHSSREPNESARNAVSGASKTDVVSGNEIDKTGAAIEHQSRTRRDAGNFSIDSQSSGSNAASPHPDSKSEANSN